MVAEGAACGSQSARPRRHLISNLVTRFQPASGLAESFRWHGIKHAPGSQCVFLSAGLWGVPGAGPSVQLVQLATIKQVTPPSEGDSPAQTSPAGWLQQWWLKPPPNDFT